MADLAQIAPNSGGFYFDEQGNLVVHAKVSAEGAIIRSRAAQLLDGPLRRAGPRRSAAVVVKPAKYSFSELAMLRDSVFEGVFTAMPGINSLDLDERQNRVALGLDPSSFSQVASSVRARLIKLGLDTGAVVLFPEAQVTRTSGVRAATPGSDLSQPFDSLVGAIELQVINAQGAFYGYCSLGFPAVRNGVSGFVTATHCTPVWGGSDTSTTWHYGTKIGDEYLDPWRYSCGLNLCRQSDAVFFATPSGINLGVGLIAHTGVNSTTLNSTDPYYIITSVDNNTVVAGESVYKEGKTSGLTYGYVMNTCVDHSFNPWPGQYTTTCNYTSNTGVAGGDSGGPFFSMSGTNEVKLLGLNLGTITGASVFTKVSRVLSEFGGSWSITRGYNLSAPSISGSVSSGYPQVSWSGVSGATKYEVYCDYVVEMTSVIGTTYLVAHWNELVGTTTSTSFTDSTPVDTYTGTTTPYYYRSYRVVAKNTSDLSVSSNVVNFSFTP
ncbi:MAG: hypothetical protein JWL61_2323 [Gemmatimonadetes bacterium]|nr:hypothetical protein [Gemmatimonadota bacterium]